MSQLENLLQQCTVKLTLLGGWGTGFFVAPEWILTCAHVVQEAKGEPVQVRWQKQENWAEAVVERSLPEPYDLALLRVMLPADANPPCVYLDVAIQSRDSLYLFGYPDQDFPNGCPVTFNCEGLTGDEPALIKFAWGQVRPGMSGAPLLNQRTGKVCGIVKFTRDRSFDLGGGAVPTRVILEQFPQLREFQQEFHQGDRRWSDLVAKRRTYAQTLHIVGAKGLSPLLVAVQSEICVSPKQSEIDFQPYLQSILDDEDYREWQYIYTPTTVEGRKRLPQPKFSPRLKRRAETVKPPNEEQEQREQVEPPWDVLAGLRNYATEHVLLIGKPGSGKSTSLERLLWEEAGNALNTPNAKIPVLVKLRRCTSTIEELIRDFLCRHQLPLEIAEIEELLRQGKFLLLLDGLNELPESFRTDIANFRDRYRSTTPMIVSTRDLSVGGNLGITKTLKMLPLTEPQMQEFVQGYLGEEGNRLFQQLKGDRLRKFAETPLLLWMLCRVFAHNGKVPDNLGLAFREFAQLHDQELQADAPTESKDQWHKLLRHLAFVMMQGKTLIDPELSIPREEVEDCLTAYLRQKDRANPRECAEQWLKDLLKYHLIQPDIQPNLEEHIEFRHQLIQEYYAAEYLLRILPELSDEQLKRDYLNYYLKWTEPIALMLALVDEEVQVLRVVKLALEVDLMLGARLAGEVQPTFQEKTVGLVNQLLVKENLPEWLKVELLGKTRSELSVPLLLQFLDSRDINIVRTAAAFLGETNDRDAIALLTNRLEDIDSQLSAQRTFRDSDPTGKIWTTHVEALACVSPQDAVRFLRKKLSVRGGFDTTLTILTMFTGAPGLLMKLDSKAMLPELIGKFQATQDNYQKSQILNLIEQVRLDDSMISQLAQILATEEDKQIQKIIIKIIGKTNSELAITTLIELIEQPSPRLRQEACNQLIECKIKQTSRLERLLSHEDWNIACAAAVVLGSLGYEKALPRLSDAIQYPKPLGIRIAATKALGKINSPTSSLYLRDALYDDDSYIRREAAFSLSKFDRREAIPELMLALRAGYLDAIRSLARLKEEEPLWNIVHEKVTGWQTAVVELVNLGRIEALSDLCQALVDIGGESANKIIHILSKFADCETINWLLDALENTEQYASDSYFCNRIALVMSGCRADVVEDKLSHLTSLLARKYIQQLFWVIPAIQNRCKFYNYELWQDAIQNQELEIKNGEKEAGVGQTTNIFIETLNAPNAAVNLGGTIHGDQSGTQSHKPKS